MLDMDDFHAFQSTTGGNGDNDTGYGCSGGCLTWILAVFAMFYLISKLSA